jgi:phosphatidylserine decarboxylase
MRGNQVIVYDRDRKQEEVEKVFGGKSLLLLSGESLMAKGIMAIIKTQPFARIYAAVQRTGFSRRKIGKVIEEYGIDASEFVSSVEDFSCFNDFFTRELKKESRPLAGDYLTAVTPCDAKYLVFESFPEDKPFTVKGAVYYLESLLRSEELARKYADGSMVVIRLDPTDYHYFRFPFDCVPGSPRLINGYLYPVNPYTMYENFKRYLEDKRVVTTLRSDIFGEVLFIEIGATTVGTINQTFRPQQSYKKGDRKGYFSFGGSSVIMLFEKGKIEFDAEFLEMSAKDIEVRSKYGQPLGKAVRA